MEHWIIWSLEIVILLLDSGEIFTLNEVKQVTIGSFLLDLSDCHNSFCLTEDEKQSKCCILLKILNRSFGGASPL